MEPGISNIHEIAGINLDDYFPERRSYNSVVFVHKKFLQKHNKGKQFFNNNRDDKERNVELATDQKKNKKKKKEKVDKSSQYDDEFRYSTKQKEVKNDSVLGHTIKFAKDIVPLAIPPNKYDNTEPVFYTIKAMKSTKKAPKKNVERQKVKSTKTETFRKEIYRNLDESTSAKESISHSSKSCLVDEININQSLCSPLSEISEKKYTKEHRKERKQKNYERRVVASDSLEALANEIAHASGDTNIKIHLMNNTDKSLLTESIRTPIINAIKDCIIDLHHRSDFNNEIRTVQRVVRCNTMKLDNIHERLSSIEKKLEHLHTGKSIITIKSPKRMVPSKIEKNCVDMLEEENESNTTQGEGSINEDFSRNRSENLHTPKANDMVEVLNVNDAFVYDDTSESRTRVGVMDKPSRIPTRFCWNDDGHR